MATWCTTWYIFEGKKEEIADLYDKLQSLTQLSEPFVENDFGKLWLGCVVALYGGDSNTMECRGTIQNEISFYDTAIKLATITTSVQANEVWNFVLKQYPSIKYYFRAEESAIGYFSTNDKEGKYFPDRYIIESENEYPKYYSKESRLFAYIANLTSTSITSRAEMYDAVNRYNADHKDDNIHVNEFKVTE